jgi:hypothetical protein
MLSDLNDYLLNDLSLIVIEYVKFSEKQLSLIMNQKVNHSDIYLVAKSRWLTHEEQMMVSKNKDPYSASCLFFKEDDRFSLATVYPPHKPNMHYLVVNSKNVSRAIDMTQAINRLDKESKKPVHFHNSTIVIADDNKTFRVYDFDSDFT